MRPIDADALQKAIDSLPISPLTQELFKGHVDVAIANAPTVAKDTNVLSNGWISVKDRLPEESKKVLVYCKNGYMMSVFFSHKWKAFNHFDSQGDPTEGENHCFLDVTHWMPLPEPPEEVSGL